MSDTDKLNRRSDKFTIVLNDNELNLFRNSRYIYNKMMCDDTITIVYLAIIKHDLDLDESTNQLKTLHYHVIIQFNGVYRVQSVISWISKLFHCNDNQITIDKCNSLCMQSRYLIHIDDFDKHAYDKTDVVTNLPNVFERYLRQVFIADLHDLIVVVKQYHYNLEDIMENIGNYDKYRKYVNDLIINHNRR